jgi:hypothetical protein
MKRKFLYPPMEPQRVPNSFNDCVSQGYCSLDALLYLVGTYYTSSSLENRQRTLVEDILNRLLLDVRACGI